MGMSGRECTADGGGDGGRFDSRGVSACVTRRGSSADGVVEEEGEEEDAVEDGGLHPCSSSSLARPQKATRRVLAPRGVVLGVLTPGDIRPADKGQSEMAMEKLAAVLPAGIGKQHHYPPSHGGTCIPLADV